MSLSAQTEAVKTAIQNAFASIKDKVNADVADVEARMVNYTTTTVNDGINEVVKYNPVIVEDAAEVTYQQGLDESFSDVFDNWLRISHNSTDTYPANATEADSWQYDDQSDTISTTVNSSTLIGFISPDKVEDYNFEVVVNSTSSDDDDIGVCAAFTVLNDREYTIAVTRNTGGLGPERFNVVYNYGQSDAIVLASTSSGLSTGGGWNLSTEGATIRVERVGDVFTFKTSDVTGRGLVSEAELTVDLNSIPELAKFKGPTQYGYVARSQDSATWETVARPIALNEIVDTANLVRWTYDGNQWNSTPISVDEALVEPRRFYYNESTGKLYISDDAGQVTEVLLPSHRNSGDHDDRYFPRDELLANIDQIVADAYSGGHTHPWSQITSAPDTATRWPTWGEVTAKPTDFPPSTHDHDDLYYPRGDIDTLLGQKVDVVAGKGLSENDFTDALLTKLNGVEVGAEVNVGTNLSNTLSASEVTILSSTGNNVTLPSATNTDAGVMSAADKTKLIGIQANAEVNLPTTADRTSSATGTVLQAKAMDDHTASGDHDARYHTKSQITTLLSGKLDNSDVLDVLTSTSPSKALSAAQGKVLKDEVDTINTLLQSDTGTLDSLQEIVDFIQLNRTDLDSLTIASIAGLQSALNNKVDAVSGKSLTDNNFTNALLSKLNGIEAGAEVNVATNLTQSRNASSYTVISSTGSNTTLAAATESAAGVMTGADKAKLNDIDANANNYVHPSNSFSMTALSGATVIDDINVDAQGHITSVGTRNLSKGNLGLGNVPNVDATNASNLDSGTLPSGRLSGSYGINITGLAARATRLDNARTINGVSFNGTANITVYDSSKVSKSGDTMTGRLNIGGTDDGVHELQVDGDTSLRGNVGVNNSNPTHAVDVDGDVRVRDNHAAKFGGTGANDDKFEIRYNPATESLDFNYLG
jgi:hypothetical protein